MIFVLLAAGVVCLVAIGLWFGRVRPDAGPRPVVIVVDGSNVMHWGEGVPSSEVLCLVLAELQGKGFSPLVYFDANVGYKLQGRHMDVAELARVLRVAARQIVVVPSGTPADPYVIEEAITMGARVVSNDRFMDWRGQYPAIRGKGFLVKGDVRGAKVALRL